MARMRAVCNLTSLFSSRNVSNIFSIREEEASVVIYWDACLCIHRQCEDVKTLLDGVLCSAH